MFSLQLTHPVRRDTSPLTRDPSSLTQCPKARATTVDKSNADDVQVSKMRVVADFDTTWGGWRRSGIKYSF